MKQIRQPGFTIIEVVLFLAISSVLAIGLMVGTSYAVQRQQYRDSVQSYANFLRDQYARVVSVQNDESTAQDCPLVTVSVPRGQSDCVIVGRYLVTDDSGDRYDTHPVFALREGENWRYAYGNSDGSYDLKWGVEVGFVGDDSGRHAIIMARHPETGDLSVRYTSNGTPSANVGNYIGTTAYSEEACVVSDGWMAGERLSVQIGARAGSGDAITVGGASDGCRYYDENF